MNQGEPFDANANLLAERVNPLDGERKIPGRFRIKRKTVGRMGSESRLGRPPAISKKAF
jgi:hypothetical protein